MTAISTDTPVTPHPVLIFARDCWRHRTARYALLTLFTLGVLAVLSPFIAPYDPYETRILDSMLPPSSDHWMGTDLAGRDIFSRILTGARISLIIGLFAVAISVTVGSRFIS